jgi:PEP-CTERM motif
LITNGGFETGSLAGWTEVDQSGGSGSWFASSSTTTPLSSHLTVGPASGAFYAVTDQTGPGSHVLIQSFTVPTGATSVVLSFDMFVNDWDNGPFCTGLDYTASTTECARVDILSAAATPFDTGAGVVDNLFSGADAALGVTNPYSSYSFNLTGILTPGQTYQLRFGEADNQSYFNQGVDNVSLLAATATPEPGTMLLFATGLFGAAVRRRKHAESN